ncbi:MAG: leucine-rich repeat domain-containing protein [Bacteroidaceae bacterium]|nr:leucine-rich repeat domain-containing protein [Bacteroidaceae bacterium]
MKKTLLKLMMVAFGMLLSMNANAYDVEVDGIYYNLDKEEKQATVTSGDSEYTGKVVIPKSFSHDGVTYSVTSIGDYAFWRCSGLTSVTIPESVTTIGDEAFEYCSGLTSVTIPNSVTSIGDRAFEFCSGLTSLTIPNSVTSIGNFAFIFCSGLTIIEVESGNPNYDSREGCNAIIETATNTLVAGCKNTIIPNSVKSIGDGAFGDCSGLTSITIPESVTSIGVEAFHGCIGLTSITIPESVTSIGVEAFMGCSGLTSVTIPNSVTSIGGWTFSGYSALTSIICYATEVPTTDVEYSPFEKVNLANVTLHVPATSIDAYKTTKPWSGFGTIVAIEDEEDVEIVPMEEDSEVAFDGGITEETDLTNTVIDNIYITIDTEQGDTYDAEDKSISLTSTVDETVVESIAGKDISDPAVREAFNGLILEVPEGTGTLSVTAQTSGNRVLNVKIGTKDVQSFAQPERGTVEIPYETGEQAYVYIYGGVAASSAKFRHAPAANSGTDVVKIYGVQWTSQSNSIEILNVDENTAHQVFTLDGRKIENLQKGVNIIRNGKEVKKVFVK